MIKKILLFVLFAVLSMAVQKRSEHLKESTEQHQIFGNAGLGSLNNPKKRSEADVCKYYKGLYCNGPWGSKCCQKKCGTIKACSGSTLSISHKDWNY